MNLNTGFFAAYNQRRKPPTVGYRLSLNNHHTEKNARSSVESIHGNESFLPSINTANGRHDGHRPYRRNDFANNHLFIAKQKLAGIFLDQPSLDNPSRNDRLHLFDQHEPKQKHRRINKNKRQEYNSDAKSTPSLDSDVHLSVVDLIMRPSLRSPQNRDPFSAISYRRAQANQLQIKAPRPSFEWINPAINKHSQLTSNYTEEDDRQSNTIINELMDNNPDIINSTNNPLDASLSYVKSILPTAGSQHR